MKSIKTKLIAYLGLLLIVVCTGLGIVSYDASSKALIENVGENLTQLSVQVAETVESRMEGQFHALEVIASMDRIKDVKNGWDDKQLILNEEVKRSGYIRMGIVDKEGKLTSTNGQISDIKDRDYFKNALSGKRAISDPIVSKVDSSIVIIYAVPIKQNNEIIGVLMVTKDGNALSEIISHITVGKSGEAYILNKDGTNIGHKNKDLVLNQNNTIENVKKDSNLGQLAELHKQMIAGKTGSGEYEYTGITKFQGFAPIKSTGWSVAVTAPKTEVLSRLSTLRNSVIIYSIIFLIISMIIIFITSKLIADGIIAISTHLSIISKGDFSVEIPSKYLKLKDEVGNIGRSMKTMQDSIKDMLLTVKDNSKNIDNQSDNLSAVAQEMSASSENVTTAIQEVAKGTGSQAGELVEISGILNQFGEELGSIIKAIKDIDLSSKGINSMAVESNDDMKTLAESVTKISRSFESFVLSITSLGSSVDKINDITNLLNSIADQTNLLALNASIEAARAGEAGRGFAVVADEIRKLAEQAKTSSASINILINGISKDTDTMVKTTDVLNDELNNEVKVINASIDSFKKIITAVNEVTTKVEAVNVSSVSIDNQKNIILEKIEGVSSIAEEVAASSQEIAASSEQMNASTQEVASTAETLSSMTKQMMGQVNKFKL